MPLRTLADSVIIVRWPIATTRLKYLPICGTLVGGNGDASGAGSACATSGTLGLSRAIRALFQISSTVVIGAAVAVVKKIRIAQLLALRQQFYFVVKIGVLVGSGAAFGLPTVDFDHLHKSRQPPVTFRGAFDHIVFAAFDRVCPGCRRRLMGRDDNSVVVSAVGLKNQSHTDSVC